jgi:hypothetical protein
MGCRKARLSPILNGNGQMVTNFALKGEMKARWPAKAAADPARASPPIYGVETRDE